MTDKQQALDLASRYVCPHRVRTFHSLGLDLVMGRRQGYRFWDMDGAELLDFHLNGGVFNLGHRNAEVTAALRDATETLDIGNHHFPSLQRGLLARRLAELTPGDLRYSVFSSGGGEAIDVAIKTARRATGRRRIVSIHSGYHGHTGLALAAGDDRAARFFLSEGAASEFTRVPFNDLDAMQQALAANDVAAAVLETIPATCGFVLPAPGYLPGVAALCAKYGALYIADEVQTGLGRTGTLWAVEGYGVEPDILVTGKGLSGGLYPMAATVLSERVAGWLDEDGWAHISSFGGAEVGCPVAAKVLEITTRQETRSRVETLISFFREGLARLASVHGDWLVEVRQRGLVIGLRFAHPQGGMQMSAALYACGLWAMFAGFEPSVLQFKPGLLLDDASAAEALSRLEAGIERCKAASR